MSDYIVSLYGRYVHIKMLQMYVNIITTAENKSTPRGVLLFLAMGYEKDIFCVLPLGFELLRI